MIKLRNSRCTFGHSVSFNKTLKLLLW
uniref:Uncharacterized protein n=1 Tax=Anguilla anguilla TaxID=7936 RepID=A0A0E9PYX8_ANGAN